MAKYPIADFLLQRLKGTKPAEYQNIGRQAIYDLAIEQGLSPTNAHRVVSLLNMLPGVGQALTVEDIHKQLAAKEIDPVEVAKFALEFSPVGRTGKFIGNISSSVIENIIKGYTTRMRQRRSSGVSGLGSTVRPSPSPTPTSGLGGEPSTTMTYNQNTGQWEAKPAHPTEPLSQLVPTPNVPSTETLPKETLPEQQFSPAPGVPQATRRDILKGLGSTVAKQVAKTILPSVPSLLLEKPSWQTPTVTEELPMGPTADPVLLDYWKKHVDPREFVNPDVTELDDLDDIIGATAETPESLEEIYLDQLSPEEYFKYFRTPLNRAIASLVDIHGPWVEHFNLLQGNANKILHQLVNPDSSWNIPDLHYSHPDRRAFTSPYYYHPGDIFRNLSDLHRDLKVMGPPEASVKLKQMYPHLPIDSNQYYFISPNELNNLKPIRDSVTPQDFKTAGINFHLGELELKLRQTMHEQLSMPSDFEFLPSQNYQPFQTVDVTNLSPKEQDKHSSLLVTRTKLENMPVSSVPVQALKEFYITFMNNDLGKSLASIRRLRETLDLPQLFDNDSSQHLQDSWNTAREEGFTNWDSDRYRADSKLPESDRFSFTKDVWPDRFSFTKGGATTQLAQRDKTKYPWLTRALDPSSPTYKNSYADEPATVQTSSVYIDNLGGEILFPTIRLVNGVLKKYSIDDAVEIALQKKDYILVKGEPQQAQDEATQLSKTISEMIANARREFAKGGTTVARKQFDDTVTPDEQMDILGLVEEQEDIDPVSGNEIPLGATAEGVRDDQTAAISPGEFVVPDHAVRYHGLDFYMKTIRVAEAGLKQMDDMGMTGNPDKATMPDDVALPTMHDDADQLQRLVAAEQAPEAVANKGAAILPAPILNFAHGGWHPPTPVNEQAGGTYNAALGQGSWGQPWQNPWGRQWQNPWGRQWQNPWGNAQPSPWGPPTIQQWQPPQPMPPSSVPTEPLPIIRPEISPTAEAEPRHIGQTPYEDFDAPQQIVMYQNAEGELLQIPETFYGEPMQPVPEGYSRMDPDASAPPPPPTPVPPPEEVPEEPDAAFLEAQERDDAEREAHYQAKLQEDRENYKDNISDWNTKVSPEHFNWVDGRRLETVSEIEEHNPDYWETGKRATTTSVGSWLNEAAQAMTLVSSLPQTAILAVATEIKNNLLVNGEPAPNRAQERLDMVARGGLGAGENLPVLPFLGDDDDDGGGGGGSKPQAAAAAARAAAAQPWRQPEVLWEESEGDPVDVEREPVALDESESEDDSFVVEEPQSVQESEPPRDQTPYEMDEGEGDMNKGGIIQKSKQSRNRKRKNGKGLAKRK